MRLPRANEAIVAPEKVRDYLLSPFHPIGRFRARFFGTLGYSQTDWELLANDLRDLVTRNDAELGERTAFGQKYAVRGIVTGPSGRSASIVAVWILRSGEFIPRLVTVIPGARR